MIYKYRKSVLYFLAGVDNSTYHGLLCNWLMVVVTVAR